MRVAHQRDVRRAQPLAFQRCQFDLDDDGAEAVDAAQSKEGWIRRGLDPLLARTDLAPAIQQALEEIPETFRSAVVLVDLEDQSYEDAAELLGIPHDRYTQAGLFPIAYTIGTDFQLAKRLALDSVVHWDGW